MTRTAVQPPKNFNPADIVRSGTLPNRKLELDYVMGFNDDNSNTSMYPTSDGELVSIYDV